MDLQNITEKPYVAWALKALLWMLLLTIFVRLEFGTVFFIVSLFYIFYAGTSSESRSSGAPSAYSVFNKNCENIQGSLTGEQFDAELRRGGR